MFGGKDLANLLSGKVGNKDASAETEGAEFAPRVDMTKRVQRYRAGQAPQWSGEGGSEGVQQREEVILAMIDRGPGAAAPAASMDRRLARLAAAAPAATTSSAATSRRRIYEAEVVVDFKNDADEEPRDKGEEEEEEDEDEEGQGPKYRQPLQQPFRAGILVPAVVPSGGGSGKREIDSSSETGGDSDSSDDSGSDESEEQEEERVKPTFVPRAKRQTAADEEARQAAEEALLRSRAMSADERKQHTRALLSESLRRAEDQDARASDAATDGDSDAGLPDDSDPDGHTPEAVATAEAEYQAWRVRELRRLKRDFEAQEQQALEKADLQRRRNMSDEERRAEDEALGKFRRGGDGPGEAGAGKGKQAFMQRYYHKGAFYMDADSINDAATDVRVNRDFHQPTGEDKFNKAALPAVMQVRKFGMRGRTKYTTLRDQDTTAREWPLDHAGGGGGGGGGGARAGGGRAGAGAWAGAGGRGGGARFRGLEERRDDDIDSAGRIKRPKL